MNDLDHNDDPFADLARDELPACGDQAPDWMKWSQPLSPRKIAVLATLAILVGSGIPLSVLFGLHVVSTPKGSEVVAVHSDDSSPEQAIAIIGRVASVEGQVERVRATDRTPLTIDDSILAHDVIATGPDGKVAITWIEGVEIEVGPDTQMQIGQTLHKSVRVTLDRGSITSRVCANAALGLVVATSRASIETRSGEFGATVGVRGLQAVWVHRDRVVVRRGNQEMTVEQGSRLDTETWSLQQALHQVEAPPAVIGVADSNGGPSTMAPGSPSLAEQVKQAVKDGDMELALKLVQSKKDGDASWLVLAGDVYRRSERWESAADAYLAAADKASGKQAERALIRAAEITFRKLGDSAGAVTIIDGYFTRFAQGSHLAEALFLGGQIHRKAGNTQKARQLFEQYVGKFPSGPQVVRVHLALAQLLAGPLADCSMAKKHAAAVKAKAPGSVMASQAAKICP